MPYIEAEPFLQELNHATDYVKTALDTEDVVIFTDRAQRSAFLLAEDIMEGFEKPFKSYCFGHEEHKEEIKILLDKMTNNAELPHVFYKNAYVAGGRAIFLQYESGELEERLGVEPYMELPKMYPDATDYALRRAQFNKCDPTIVNFIQQEIQSRKIVIFSKSYCSFSRKAKAVFHDCDQIFYSVELDLRRDGFEILNALEKITGNNHTPFVFLKGEYFGGGAIDFLEIHELDEIRITLDVPPRPIYPLNRVYERTKEYVKKKYFLDKLVNPEMVYTPQNQVYSEPPIREDMTPFITRNMPTYVSDLMKFFFLEKDRYGYQLSRVPQ